MSDEKRPPGRPPKKEKSLSAGTWLTEREFDDLVRKAAAADQSLSAFIRDAVTKRTK